MGSLQCFRIGGIVIAILDLLFSLYILGYYSHYQYRRYHCNWAHGIRSCDFFMHESNHHTRTIIGIATGIFSIFFSIILLVSFLKRMAYLAWVWLFKALVVIIINIYFISDALVKRGRYYHSFWDPNEYDEETVFIVQSAAELVIQFVLSIFFCCFAAFFTYAVRHQSRGRIHKAAESVI